MQGLTNSDKIKTTVIGIIVMVIGLLYFGLPYFIEGKDLWEVHKGGALAIFIVGILLILEPGKIIGILSDMLGKFTNKK